MRQRQPSAGRRGEQHRGQGKAVHTHPGGRLDEHVADGSGDLPDAAPGVPREPGQHELPRQIRQHPGAGQCQDPWPARTRQAGDGARGRNECREAGRRCRHRERHQPPEAIGLEQDCLGDPIQAEKMVAEAEPPAASRRDRGAARAIEQGKQAGHRDQQHRDGVHRRQRGSGQRAQTQCGEVGTQAAHRGELRQKTGNHACRLHDKLRDLINLISRGLSCRLMTPMCAHSVRPVKGLRSSVK